MTLRPDAEPVPVGPKPASLKITNKGRKKMIPITDVYDAAARLGLQPVHVDELNGYHILGEYIEEKGAIPIGRAMLLMAHQHIAGGLKKCDQLLSADLGVESTTAVLQSLQGLAVAQIKAANSLIESDSRADMLRNQDPPPALPPPPRQTVVPIQTNSVTIVTDGQRQEH